MLIKTSFQLTKPHQCTLKREILSFFHTFLFMVAMLIGAYLFVSLKTSMTGFYKSFTFEYRSNRMRRMCLIQVNLCQNLFFLKIVLNVRNNFCTQHVLPRFELGIFMYWTCKSMNNLSWYCGLVDAKIRASDKNLPVQLASAEDKAKTSQHRSPCSGLVLRGRNIDHEANLKKRHEFQD